jgi:phosphonopyruvate decarboxylase
VRVISAQTFVEAARKRGFGLWTGVPCSYLKPFINYVIDAPDLRYVAAANEGDAVAVATGADLGGVRAIAMFQNSGLGNAVNPLTSLNAIFRIPILVITTLRGEPGGPHDEPQHALMGPITTRMLELMQIPWEYFPREAGEVEPALARVVTHMETKSLPYALVIKKGSVADWKLKSVPKLRPVAPSPPPSEGGMPRFTREAILGAVQASLRPGDVVIASTGFTGRELYSLEDRREQLYMVGSMGCAMSLGLGLALVRPKLRVIVLDGDGAALMRMGGLATVGYERPPNLVHVLLDNQMYESTGGQSTVSHSVDFCAIAAACGYPRTALATKPEEVAAFLDGADGAALGLLHVKILPGSPGNLPRPTITPPEVASRLRAYIIHGK